MCLQRSCALNPFFTTSMLLLAVPTALAAESFVDTFDDGETSCWHGGSAWTDVFVESAGGNDAGWLRSAASRAPYFSGIATEKPEAGGDWIIAEVSALQVDVRRVVGAPTFAGFRVREGGDVNGWFYTVPVEQLTESWSTLVAPIDPSWTDQEAEAAGWVKEASDDPSWQETLASHYQLSFRAWHGTEPLEMGYDNFVLTFDGPSCSTDVNEDRQVDLDDLLMVLSAWGRCDCCPPDVTRDRAVDFDDLLAVIANWGPCWEG